jgi:hypothetical protein
MALPSSLKTQRKFVLAITALVTLGAVAIACRTASKKSQSYEKVYIRKLPNGMAMDLDLSECIAKKLVKTNDDAIEGALNIVEKSLNKKLEAKFGANTGADGANPNVISDTFSTVRQMGLLDAKSVNGAIKVGATYLANQKELMYDNSKFMAISAIPNAYILGFYHQALGKKFIDIAVKKFGVPLGSFPYIGLVIVPTCTQTVAQVKDPKNPDKVPQYKKGQWHWRIQIAAAINVIWRVRKDEVPPQSTGGQTITESANPANIAEEAVVNATEAPKRQRNPDSKWRIIFGTVFGPVVKPQQLTGLMFGFGHPINSMKLDGLPKEKIDEAMKEVPWYKQRGVTIKTLLLAGSDPSEKPQNPLAVLERAKDVTIGSFVPSQLVVLMDLYDSPTKYTYITPYVGINYVTGNISSMFTERPVVLYDESKDGVKGKLEEDDVLIDEVIDSENGDSGSDSSGAADYGTEPSDGNSGTSGGSSDYN